MILAYLRAARRESSSLFAPVQTILPEENIKAVVRGSRIRIMTAANRLGLYSALRACKAIFFKSSLQHKFTVETMFLKSKKLYRVVIFEVLEDLLQLRYNSGVSRARRHGCHRCCWPHRLMYITYIIRSVTHRHHWRH